MKSYVVLIVIAATLAAGTALHAYRTSQPSELDAISRSLKKAQTILPAGSHISFKGEASKPELLSWARYAMVPHFLDASGQYDTTLIIRYKANGDTLLTNSERSRNLFWQYTDSIYQYSLSTSR